MFSTHSNKMNTDDSAQSPALSLSNYVSGKRTRIRKYVCCNSIVSVEHGTALIYPVRSCNIDP